MTKKIYTAEDVEMIRLAYIRGGKSIRGLAKFYDIPKSVVGRWVKNPKHWKTQYDIAEGNRKLAGWSPKRKKAWKNFQDRIKRSRDKDPKKYDGMQIRYDEDDDFEPYSG